MNWFRDLKTYQKISSTIAVMSILILIAGLIGYYYDTKSHHEIVRVHDHRLLAIEYLNSIRTDLRTNQASLYQLIFSNNISQKKEYLTDINIVTKKVDHDLSRYKTTSLDPYERDKLSIITNNLEKYRLERAKVINSALSGKSQEAYNHYQTELFTLDNVNTGLENLINYNLKFAEKEFKQSTDYSIKSKNIVTGGILLALAFVIFMGLKIASMISGSLDKVVANIEKVASGNLNVSDVDIKSKDEMGILARSLNTMTHNIRNLVERERILRQIVIEARKFQDHDEIYNYLLEQLTSAFNMPRGIHLHETENQGLIVLNEVLKNTELKPLKGQIIFCEKCVEELFPTIPNQIVVVNNVNKEIKNSDLQKFLLNNDIQAFLSYPTTSTGYLEERGERILGTTMICSTTSRNWMSDEIDFFKLIIETVSIIFLEIRQRQETEEIRRTFLATLTHDLRSPLNAEQKALESILSRKLGTSLDDLSEYLEDMHKSNEELLRLVNNILSVYHYESGKWELKLEPNNINELIENTVRTLQHLAKDQESDITVNIQPDLPQIMIDKDEICRVLGNLISNAIKHNRKGTCIKVEAKKVNNEIQISVSDNGSGISESERPKIFQRYPTAKRKIGTGLGLYLSKQIIDAHNGRIWFESEVGKGTTFYFTLPIT